MGSRCYDDTRLIGCGSGWELGRGEGKKDGKKQKGMHIPNHARHTSPLQREKKKKYRECRVTELFNLDNETKIHTE